MSNPNEIQPVDLRYTIIIRDDEYVLPQSPSGWEDTLFTYERSPKYFGMLRNYTVDAKFVLDGAWLLRREFYQNGVEGEALLQVELLQRSNWSYEIIYTGDVDFSTFIDEKDEVTVKIMESGISRMVKAYEGVKYEFLWNDLETIEVRLPGVDTVESANDQIGVDIFDPQPVPPSGQNFIFALPTISVLENNTPSAEITVQPVTANPAFPTTGPGSFPDSDQWFASGNNTVIVRISGFVAGTLGQQPSGGANYSVSIQSSNGNTAGSIMTNPGSSNTEPVEYEQPFDFEYGLQAGENLFLLASCPVSSTPTQISIAGQLHISYSVEAGESICRAIRPKPLFDLLMDRMNRQFVPTKSNILELNPNLVITSGDSVRQIDGLDFDNPKLKTSFNEFFQSINAVMNVGFGVENETATLEGKSYWMRANLQIVDLGEIKDFALEPAIEHMFSSIKTGYKDQDYESDLGRGEYNSEQVYSTPITRVQTQLDITSAYRADQFGIEELRTTTASENANSEDKEYDNDVFFLWIENEPGLDGVYDVVGRDSFASVEGVPPGERYNIDLSPKRNLIRHGNYIRSGLHRLDTRTIFFESGEKNTDLSTVNQLGGSVTENSNLQIAGLSDPLFMPYLVKFTTKLTRPVQQLLDSRPTGHVQFIYDDNIYQGFVVEASADVARNTAQEWTLLLIPGQNLLNLIK